MDEEEIDELIQSIDEIEDAEIGRELFLEIVDALNLSEKAG